VPDDDRDATPARDVFRETPAPARPRRLDVLVAISVGGALGAGARYALGRALPHSGGGFPWGTFWANVSGAFALGLVLVVLVERFPPGRYVRPFVAVGLLGAYTTFSTFAVETTLLVRDGHPSTATAYALGSVVAGLAAAFAGAAGARRLTTAGGRS